MSERLLIVEDDEVMRFTLRELLDQRGYEVVEAEDAETAIEIAQKESIDLVILDIRLPGMSGLKALPILQQIDVTLPVIIITAYGDKEKAIEAIKKGAYDYFTKPFKTEEIEIVIKRALEKRQLQREVLALKEQVYAENGFKEIVGQSEAIKKVFYLLRKILNTDVTVLITGESGTGKELIAFVLHYYSPRREMPFIKINCAAIPEMLLESELFGYEKGAFTGALSSKPGKFELAHKGTIFLDEIGEMPLSTQAKLLRVLQEREFERLGGTKTIKVDVRLIASSNRDLWEAVQKNEFREDLYFRLNVVNIHLPPLRDRKEDLPLLVEHFIKKFNKKFNKEVTGVSQQTLALLYQYPWPGNVRELENCIERAVLLSPGNLITPEELPPQILGQFEKESFHSKNLDEVIQEVEKKMIVDALRKAQGIQAKAAKILGINERSLWHRVKKYKIDVKPFKMKQQ